MIDRSFLFQVSCFLVLRRAARRFRRIQRKRTFCMRIDSLARIATLNISSFLARAHSRASRVQALLYFRLDGTRVESISLHVARPRHAAVVRFVETSVSGKRDWTAEGNVQEIKLARRLGQKRGPRRCRLRPSSNSAARSQVIPPRRARAE